jgi:hypothetical protein
MITFYCKVSCLYIFYVLCICNNNSKLMARILQQVTYFIITHMILLSESLCSKCKSFVDHPKLLTFELELTQSKYLPASFYEGGDAGSRVSYMKVMCSFGSYFGSGVFVGMKSLLSPNHHYSPQNGIPCNP